MADTKQAKSKAKSSKAQSRKPSAGSASKAKSKTKAKTAKAAKNGAQATAKNGTQSTSSNGSTPVLEKAKVPLLAGGAAVVGVAGAVIAATHSGGKRKVLGVSVPKKRSKLHLPKKNGFKTDAHKVAGAVADAAKRADTIGQGVSRIASSVKQVSESADDAVKKT